MQMQPNLLIIGHGYTGIAILELARRAGWNARVTSRNPGGELGVIAFDDPALLEGVTHLAVTATPSPRGDPAWAMHAAALRSASLRWVGYISTTGVYGDRQGGWVEEDTLATPGQERSHRRLAAEDQWRALATSVDIFRTGGIYGPGRSALDDVRAGTARRVWPDGRTGAGVALGMDVSAATSAGPGVVATLGRRGLARVAVPDAAWR